MRPAICMPRPVAAGLFEGRPGRPAARPRLLPRVLGILAMAGGLSLRAGAPVVQSVTTASRETAQGTVVDVTFSFSDPESDQCWVALWGHDAESRTYVPMCHFTQADVFGGRWSPGTHTVSWLSSRDFPGGVSSQFVVYVRASDSGRIAPNRFLAIDLSPGPAAESYPLQYLEWADLQAPAAKTSRLLLRELPDGSFVGVFEVTQRQYALVTALDPSTLKGDTCPVNMVSWNEVKTADGFLPRLSRRTGLTFDLPTGAQWEYACRAATTLMYNDYTQNRGKGTDSQAALDYLAWYVYNSNETVHPVGTKQPNAWGLYDLHGNVWELITDPSVKRGGCYNHSEDKWGSGEVTPFIADGKGGYAGFRAYLPAP